MSARLTEAQRKALVELWGVECGWVHASTAKALLKAGLIEKHPTSRISDWWNITEAGREALRALSRSLSTPTEGE